MYKISYIIRAFAKIAGATLIDIMARIDPSSLNESRQVKVLELQERRSDDKTCRANYNTHGTRFGSILHLWICISCYHFEQTTGLRIDIPVLHVSLITPFLCSSPLGFVRRPVCAMGIFVRAGLLGQELPPCRARLRFARSFWSSGVLYTSLAASVGHSAANSQ